MYLLNNPHRFGWTSEYIEDNRYEGGYTFIKKYEKKELTNSDLNENEKNYINLFIKNYWEKLSNGNKPEEMYEFVWDRIKHLEYDIYNIPRNATRDDFFSKLPNDHMDYQEILWFIFLEVQKSKDRIEMVSLANHILNVHIDVRQTRGKNLDLICELLIFLCSVDETDIILKFAIQLFNKDTENVSYNENGVLELEEYQEKTLIPFYNILMSDIFTSHDKKLRFLVSLHRKLLLECGFTIAAEKIKNIIYELDKELAQQVSEEHSKEYHNILDERAKTFRHNRDTNNFDDSRSIWDDYDEDGVPYNDYD